MIRAGSSPRWSAAARVGRFRTWHVAGGILWASAAMSRPCLTSGGRRVSGAALSRDGRQSPVRGGRGSGWLAPAPGPRRSGADVSAAGRQPGHGVDGCGWWCGGCWRVPGAALGHDAALSRLCERSGIPCVCGASRQRNVQHRRGSWKAAAPVTCRTAKVRAVTAAGGALP
jgi:hypothetical protein